MAILINDNTARVQYTATSGQTTFAVPFEFFENSDLKVYRNSALQTITTHYTLTGAGVTGGGNLTFVSGVTLNDIITIVRDIPIQRVTDFPLSGPFNITALNLQLDQLTAMIQEVSTLITTRVPLLSEFDQPSVFSAIPTLANRANRYFYWDADGNPTAIANLSVVMDSFEAALGTAAAPTYTFTGDLNTGMWSPGADTIAFSEGGVEAMRITSAGNVGIGLTSPPQLLAVGNTTDQFGAGISAAITTVYFGSPSSGSGGIRRLAYDRSTGNFDFIGGSVASPSTQMTVTSVGNVGIGTSAPGYRLDIASGDTTASLGFAMRLRSNATATAATIQFTNSTSSAQTGTITCTDAGVMVLQSDGASSILAFRINGNERFRILSTGGITSGDLADAVGYKGLPQNAKTASYTLALSDMGKHISITTGGVVIPANGSVAFPIGSTIVIYNDSASAQNISITTDTLRLAGTATTGTRSLAQRGLATCVKVLATEWVVSGNVT